MDLSKDPKAVVPLSAPGKLLADAEPDDADMDDGDDAEEVVPEDRGKKPKHEMEAPPGATATQYSRPALSKVAGVSVLPADDK